MWVVEQGEKQVLPVRYAQCVIPDTFIDRPEGGVEATVEGALTSAGDFQATLVMAKCTSKYDKDNHKMMDDGAKPSGPTTPASFTP